MRTGLRIPNPHTDYRRVVNPDSRTGVPHQLTEDDTYQGYFMPKDATVMFNVWFVIYSPLLPPAFHSHFCVRTQLQGYHEE